MLSRHHPRLTALIAGAVLTAVPAQTQACWLFDCFGHHSRTTFYAPVAAAAPACAPCTQQTVRYVPQTALRPLVTTTPVTALRPVAATDPCTGCPTTVMRPTTTYVQRTVMMPYTSYRPVVQTSLFAPAVAAPAMVAPACPTGACAPAATTTYYQPAYQPASVPATISQPACCSPSAATFAPTSSTTVLPGPGATSYGAPTGTSQRTFADGQSGLPGERIDNSANDNGPNGSGANSSGTNGSGANGSGANGSGSANGTALNKTSVIRPIPEVEDKTSTGEETSLPELRDPRNRTTSTSHGNAYAVAWSTGKPVVAQRSVRKLADRGWEAAR